MVSLMIQQLYCEILVVADEQGGKLRNRVVFYADELKSIPKGNFVVMKTGTHPMKTKLRLFLDWGISFDSVFTMPERANRKVTYVDKQVLEESIARKHISSVAVDIDTGELLEPPTGTGTLHTPVAERRVSHVKT